MSDGGGIDGIRLSKRSRLRHIHLALLPLRDVSSEAGDNFVSYALEVLIVHLENAMLDNDEVISS